MSLTSTQLQQIGSVAVRLASMFRAAGEECRPALLLFKGRPDDTLGDLAIVPLSFDKSLWPGLQRRFAREPGIAAAVIVAEAWQVQVTAPRDLEGRPSEHPDREEVLLVNVLAGASQWIGTCAITGDSIAEARMEPVRTDTGPQFEGRFIQPSMH